MNTFFPTLQLFFESGLSCTIAASRMANVTVGLDPKLRFRLTDCSHEEDGQIIKTTLSEKFARAGTGIMVREAVIAQRTSIAVAPIGMNTTSTSSPLAHPHAASITHQVHTVVGLRLDGMSSMAYIWAKCSTPNSNQHTSWDAVRIAGLRDDVPCPLLRLSSARPQARRTNSRNHKGEHDQPQDLGRK